LGNAWDKKLSDRKGGRTEKKTRGGKKPKGTQREQKERLAVKRIGRREGFQTTPAHRKVPRAYES